MGQTPTKITKPWADHPFDLVETPSKRLGITDPSKANGATMAGTEMALAHNVLIRTLNCIYLQAPNVKLEKDIADFIVFMDSWAIAIREHHAHEEELFFPWLEEYIGEKDYLHKNVEQHHAFAPGLQEFADYVTALKEGKETYDSTKIRSIIDSFGAILSEHLKDEITSFEDLEKFGDKIDWKTWNKRVADTAVKMADMTYTMPMGITNMDFSFEAPLHNSFWPPYPWIAGQVFRWIFIPRQKGAWRFSSCDDYGYPKNLEFVDEPEVAAT